ncbi:uncharacterized protein LOC114877881 [Osmia bicornis bicornis]|uniref:uncharacterized protein LOC114877881 n=1 Tax=Osmia bicornis bicornis TaxID=1437191 RepID=UPI001EAEB825|nr:uncharacterized protein LOC114877881 [Osmia bicornis bicornis]XP_029046834.2 uncharacterized protein LOC114877881 [Osmia bicornis bicornis]XP_029046835.2 uncharacterized protein LOC114877881 [Osmia bicornis bicornis]
MHPRAFYTLALMLLVAGDVGCNDKTKWYVGLQTVFKNCPLESWRNAGQDEFMEKLKRCIQEHVLAVLDSILVDDVIPVFDGLYLVRFQQGRTNSTDNYTNSELEDDTNWTAMILKRLIRVLRTHVFKVDVDHLVDSTLSPVNNSETELNGNIFEGRRRRFRRKYNNVLPFMMMGFLLMGSILVPMGFQFLAVLGGKALLLAKMALILSSIQGLKKIATNGVNYGLYHTQVDGWHDRSHIETPSHLDLPFQPHIRP